MVKEGKNLSNYGPPFSTVGWEPEIRQNLIDITCIFLFFKFLKKIIHKLWEYLSANIATVRTWDCKYKLWIRNLQLQV